MTEQVTEVLGAPKEGCCNVLLAHNPVYFDTYAAWGADLTLSGHLHGGIVRLPLLGGVISPQMKLFPDYTRGCYTKEKRSAAFISAAVSTTPRMQLSAQT